MSLVIALDAGPLGLLTHRKDNKEAEACRKWLASHIAAGSQIVVPAIADYEVRRELIRAGKSRGISRLDEFLRATPDRYLPPTADAFQKAAELWAKVRKEGQPTAGHEALDADVLLAAQLLTSKFARERLVVATTNPKHIARFLDAREWQSI
ncbi:MAG: PIN domain-containing protein [Tepidisphaeraceae bacterium]